MRLLLLFSLLLLVPEAGAQPGTPGATRFEMATERGDTTYYARSSMLDELWGEWDVQWTPEQGIAWRTDYEGPVILWTSQRRDGCEADFRNGVVSLVGPVVSYHLAEYWDCRGAARPGYHESFETLDLTTGESADLLQWFAEADVLQAMRSDRVIREAATYSQVDPDALGVDDLSQIMLETGEGPVALGEGWSTRFAFHHVDGDRVAVRIPMRANSGAGRYAFAEIGLLLPIPPRLQAHLAAADAGGTLMEDLEPLRDAE